jgi:arsenate reductase
MITVYGIKNCDTMQKAMKWLSTNKIAFVFHDYKIAGIDKKTINAWLKTIPLEQVLNKKGTTFRNLSELEKSDCLNSKTAVPLIISKPSLIKRPLWDLGKEVYVVGFTDAVQQQVLSLK